MTLAWRNQDHIRRWFLTSDLISPEQHRAWFEQYQDRDDDFVFVIEETETLKPRPIRSTARAPRSGYARFRSVISSSPRADGRRAAARLRTSVS